MGVRPRSYRPVWRYASWLATLSIVAQVFCNLEMMRYTLYSGEPILVGCFRSKPGPMFWLWVYLALDFAAIWPLNAAHAAGPLAAAILGYLPGDATTTILDVTMQEATLSRLLGYAVFLVAFVPLVFGGVIYRVIERIMTAKLMFVLVTCWPWWCFCARGRACAR